ncbi:CDP-diacylglycerol--glycerol-3-phosphate 3-phosphatidyltransferase [Williamsia sp. Leaf354]|uniref:CDP-alcohol phosphatidyltransferase family protein n=1 Tax=Williamsia sp. Leaf354 TaxID=1736349 RepID=UPI0006F5D11D|nr:CDP-alcohol phosphatidyltransferase family protein [Williamsia sp. Leaf354]KQR98460.1 CDP-diacylglycerol--glycerol-3-phosphate 3-phosphatidyltransferase [Williamsia sp. Leaf354]
MDPDGPAATADAPSDRILTVPNLLSFLRLLLVPVFVWLLLFAEADGWAFVVLLVSGFSDWADGKLARLLNQSSRLGALLDPAADRLYMIVIPIGLGIRDIVPWWMIAILLARDLLLLASVPLLRSRGMTALPVTYVGKAATFSLMYGFPFVLGGQLDGLFGDIMHPIGWAFLVWGIGMYLWSFVQYWWQTVLVLRQMPRVGSPMPRVGG